MSRLIFEEEYIIVIPSFKDVKPHRHDFYHMFFQARESGQEIFITGSKMVHTMPPLAECRLFLIIDPTSDLAGHLHGAYLSDGTPERIRPQKRFSFCDEAYADRKSDDEIRADVRAWLSENDLPTVGNSLRSARNSGKSEAGEGAGAVEDYRVVRLIRDIREYRHLEKKVEEIAREYNLSESRLSHVFKETVGISLKGYLTIAQLRRTYQLVMEGKSKTYAAMEAGFATPAHLAFICKKQMGISISDVLR